MANIKVAVRVRPISARELNLTGSEVVVRTDLDEISLTNLKVSSSKAGDSRERTRKYGFDYCFDSSDPEAENFADQEKIYRSLGQTVLDAVFSGYNSCLVAYGQSASGKTYTMMGTKEDPGLTPRLCEGLFARLEEERKNERNFCVSVSYLEIYNERVRDLLKPSSSTSGLRVREHPRLGPYVQGLTYHAVHTLGALMSYVEEGTKARKTASTLQNPSSSRSHALLTIAVAEESQGIPSSVSTGAKNKKKKKESLPRGGSKLRLVDLAGSESAATCSGVHRLKEGANINKSLVALGNVISALAERGSTGSGPGRRFIPYRDSSLTWLLKDALGGNATTIMLATISPASGSYNETAHTLRFAQRAQSVVNRPVVNENPVARIIRELRAEVARLKSLLLEKNIHPDTTAVCCCQRSQSNCNKDQSPRDERETDSTRRSTEEDLRENSQENPLELIAWEERGSRSAVTLRRSNSSDSVTRCEVSSPKKFGSLEFLATDDRFAGGYSRARVTELNDEEDEISEIHESVFVDIPTLVAVLIKPDDNLQESSARIEEICPDEVAEEPIDVCQFIEAANEGFELEKSFGIDHDERSGSVNSCHACGDNEHSELDQNSSYEAKSPAKLKAKPKFRKQDSVDVLSTSLLSNLHASKKFGSVETIQKKKDPLFCLERSHTNLEKRSTLEKAKKLNNIREIDDRKSSNKGNWRGSKEQLQRKGSNDSDKSSKDTNGKNYARKPSLENSKRKTSKDSSSSSSKDEQILISSLARDKLLLRKNSFEQEASPIRSHTPIQRAKRAEIVAAVTERLYSSRKPMDESSEIRTPPESGDAKCSARMKLQEISRKMLGKRRRVCVDTQTDSARTIRMKDSASLTETPQIVYQDAAVLTDHSQNYELDKTREDTAVDKKIPVLRVKEVGTLTEKPKTNIVRCKDVASSANDLEDYDYEIHLPRNDSGILSDDTQNYAESNISSNEISDLCPEADRRVAYAESSTNTSIFSSCRSFAVQTTRPEVLPLENKAPPCVRQCCVQSSQNSSPNAEKNIISISLPDAISITIESANVLESRIASDVSRQNLTATKDGEAQTDEDVRNEIFYSQDRTRSTPSQTDRVFRIENIFQDPNNSKNSRADGAKGARIRNSITLRNSLGTSYVSQRQPGDLTSQPLPAEGFIRDGLITEAFISRKRGFHFRNAPSEFVCQDSWRNWQVPVSVANASVEKVDYAKGSASSWQPEVDRIAKNCQSLINGNNPTFRQLNVDAEICETKLPSCSFTVPNSKVDYDHGFSDDSLDYNETNVGKEKRCSKVKQKMVNRENLCPPDVVAHTKKDSPKSVIETKTSETFSDFEDNQVEFPKKNPIESMETIKIHDYKSLILGRPSYKFDEINDELDSRPLNHSTISAAKKKVSFSSSNLPEQTADGNVIDSKGPKTALKSIIKKRKKKSASESTNSIINSSNDETTDDSQQEEKTSFASANDWKEESQCAGSTEAGEHQNSMECKGISAQSRKKVKFSTEEFENTCSESDSCENLEEDEEEAAVEDVPFDCTSRNVLEEYLNEAVTFMRNLNSISEYVNGTSMPERYPTSPCRGRGGRRGIRRRSSSSWSRDYLQYTGRKVNLKNDGDSPVEDDDIVASTESYERCLKGIERLEDCIRRVDKHNELLSEKYGVNCESASARPDLASPRIDLRVPTTNYDYKISGETEIPTERSSSVAQPEEEDDLEKKIFDQLMNVANSIRYGNPSKLQTRFSNLSSDSASRSTNCGKFREKHSHASKKPFSGDVKGSLSLEEVSDASDDQQDFTTYEITGNLSVGKTCFAEEDNDDLTSTLDEDFLPLRRFNRLSNDVNGATSGTKYDHDDLPSYSFLSKYDGNDNDQSLLAKARNLNFATQQRVCLNKCDSPINTREKFQESDDYSRRTREGSCRMCACSKEQDIEGTSSEMAHLRDKLKYPGSPRARFLELLRERRRIVECSRGTSAS